MICYILQEIVSSQIKLFCLSSLLCFFVEAKFHMLQYAEKDFLNLLRLTTKIFLTS